MGCWKQFNIYLRNLKGKTARQIKEDVDFINEAMYKQAKINCVDDMYRYIKLEDIHAGNILHIELSFVGEGSYELAENIRDKAQELGYDFYMEDLQENGGYRYYALYDGLINEDDISAEEREPYALLSQLENDAWKSLTGMEIASIIQGVWGESNYFVRVV